MFVFLPRFLIFLFLYSYAAPITPRNIVSIHACPYNSILRQCSLLYKLYCAWDVIQGLWPVGSKLYFWCFGENQKGLQEARDKEKGVWEGLLNNWRIKRMDFSLAECHLMMSLLSTVTDHIEKMTVVFSIFLPNQNLSKLTTTLSPEL